MDYILKKKLESIGFKFKYPPKPGYVVPLTDDRMFRIFLSRLSIFSIPFVIVFGSLLYNL